MLFRGGRMAVIEDITQLASQALSWFSFSYCCYLAEFEEDAFCGDCGTGTVLSVCLKL